VKFKAQFDNADLALFPNQFVNIRLLVDTLRDVTIVPLAAIQYGPAGAFVYLVGDDDAASMRLVAIDRVEADRAAVRSGIAAGERVVVAGADRVRQGAKVRILDLQTDMGAAAASGPPSGQGGR
jgi:multidrug efflux system membrane fusion protein